MKNYLLYLFIAALMCITYGHANAQTSSRLIGEADSSQFYDTMYYAYSGGRGGDLNHVMKFDSSFSITPLGVDLQIAAVWQKFDVNSNLITSIERITEPGCGISGFIDVSKDSNVYDPRNNRIANYNYQGDTTPGHWTPHDSVFYTYDSKNNMLSLLKPSVERDSFSYDASNNLIAQYNRYWSIAKSTWENGDATTYTYSGGLLQSSYYYIWIASSGTFTTGSATFYYYNSSKKLIKKVALQLDPWVTTPDSLTYQQIDSNVYDAAGDMTYSYHAQYNDLDLTWQYSRDSNAYDAVHNMVADAQQLYDTLSKQYETNTQLSYAYNILHQRTRLHSQTSPYSVNGNYTSRYYYELYTPTAVATINSMAAKINVFPNPANAELNLHVQWTNPQAFTVGLYDMQGKLLRQWAEQKTTEYQKQIPMSMLPAGNYILNIKGENGSIQQQISIVH